MGFCVVVGGEAGDQQVAEPLLLFFVGPWDKGKGGGVGGKTQEVVLGKLGEGLRGIS